MLNLMRRRPIRGIAGNSKKSEDNSFWPLIASPLLEGSILLLTHTYNQTILRKTLHLIVIVRVLAKYLLHEKIVTLGQ